MKHILNVKNFRQNKFPKKTELKLKKYNVDLDNHSIKTNMKFKSFDSYSKINKIKKDIDKFESFRNNYILEENQKNNEEDKIDFELFEEIKILWYELGIKRAYQNEFESFLMAMNNKEKILKYLKFEKDNLFQLKKCLIKFMKERKFRSTNIETLKELNNKIFVLKNKKEKINISLIQQIIDCFKEIRISSINIIKNIINIREFLSVFFTKDKIDICILYKNFLYDINYLLKMNFELQFLKCSEINEIFETKKEEYFDTFLISYSNIKNSDEKIIINISKEILNSIEKCRYYLFHEGIINNMNQVNSISKNRYKKRIYLLKNSNYKNNSSLKTSNRKSFNLSLRTIKSQLGNEYKKLFINSSKGIKIPKYLTSKTKRFVSYKPKTNIITIERENFIDNSIYIKDLEDKIVKGVVDNIKSKEEEKTINFDNLYIEQNANLNINTTQLKSNNNNNNKFKENIESEIINQEGNKNNEMNIANNKEIVNTKKAQNINEKENKNYNLNNTEFIKYYKSDQKKGLNNNELYKE